MTQVCTTSVETIQQNSVVDTQQTQGHWGENRLADVVKGTARGKGSSKDSGSDQNSPRATSPLQNSQGNQITCTRQVSTQAPSQCNKDVASSTGNGDIQLCTVTLTPPNSPEKLVFSIFNVI